MVNKAEDALAGVVAVAVVLGFWKTFSWGSALTSITKYDPADSVAGDAVKSVDPSVGTKAYGHDIR